MSGYSELLGCGNLSIVDAAMKCEQVFHDHNKALVSISGGADSDIMLDLCERVRQHQPIDIIYNWNNTGIEYAATKSHLAYLEERYGIEICKTRPAKPIPICALDYGQPFLSKIVSEQMGRLQAYGFGWEDEPLESLQLKYPNVPTSALRWWTNDYAKQPKKYNSFCVGRNKWLKEFITENHPWFKISSKCCTYAKKRPAYSAARKLGCDVNIVGTRKAEGGVRSLSGKCFDSKSVGPDIYRPLYWLTEQDRAAYVELFGIVHSDCYEVWGFKRTGCIGCPFNRQAFDDLSKADAYEPNMTAAARKIFADSYEYTRMFNEFKKSIK